MITFLLGSRSPTRVIFDVDSTVLVVYGKQEQARIGYNPLKRGRPSYHPLLLLRGSEPRLLARGVAARRRPYRRRGS